jgi:hypothetical protein
MQFVPLNYSWVKEVSITDGENPRPASLVLNRKAMVTTAQDKDVVIE